MKGLEGFGPEEIKGRAVLVARGRKVPKGTTGILFWAKEGQYGLRTGIHVNGNREEVAWTAASNLEFDESPEGIALEAEAKASRDEWIANRKAEDAVGKAAAEKELAESPPSVKKGDTVFPSEGPYALMRCRVIWVGASKDGIRVGVTPKVRPTFYGGRPVWPKNEASWLPVGAVETDLETAGRIVRARREGEEAA